MAEVTAFRNNALPYPIYGAPWAVTFPMLDADGDLVTGATTPDAEVSKNGDTFADCTNESTEIATSSGVYYLLLTAAEMTADIVTVIAKSATAGMKTTVITLYPRKLVSLRTGTAQGGAAGYITLDASAGARDDRWNGCVCVAVIDTLTEVRVITDYTGSNQQAAVTPNWNVVPDSDDTFTLYLPEGMQLPTVNVGHIAETAQTARDIGASVLLSPGTGTGQLDITSGVAKANAVQLLGTAWLTPAVAGTPDVNAKQFGGAPVTATTSVTIPAASTLATTAGAVGSVTGAVGSVTGAVGSVTGNVGGNVVGSVASVTAGVTVTTNNDKTGYGLSSAAVQAIWDALTSALTTVGSIGKKLADWVIGTTQTGDTYALANGASGFVAIKSDTAAILVDTGTTLDGRIPAALVGGRMDASVGAMAANTLTASALAADAVTEIQAGLSTVVVGDIPTAAANADAVWDEAIAGHLGAGSTGAALNAAGSAGDPWTTPIPGAYGAGTAGKIIGDNLNATVGSRSSHSAADVWASAARTLTAATNITSTGGTTVPQTGDSFARLGAPAGVSTSADIAAVKADSAAIKAKTDNLPTDPADESLLEAAITAATSPLATAANLAIVAGYTDDIGVAGAGLTALGDTRLANLDAAVSTRAVAGDAMALTAGERTALTAVVWAYVVEGTHTAVKLMRLFAAALAGKLSGAATATNTIRDIDDTKNRIIATVDADGNRTAITLDES